MKKQMKLNQGQKMKRFFNHEEICMGFNLRAFSNELS